MERSAGLMSANRSAAGANFSLIAVVTNSTVKGANANEECSIKVSTEPGTFPPGTFPVGLQGGFKINIYWLAENAVTSIEQLERFYLERMKPTGERVRSIQSFGQ